MTLQLGFDGAVKLLDGSPESLRECLALTGDRYREYARAIDPGDSERGVYWRIVFSLLSVQSPLDATFSAYKTLRLWRARFGRVPSQGKLRSLILNARGSDGVVQYTHQKALYIREFDANWREDPARFLRCGDTDADWRARIQANVKGLGLAKASFAVALSNPATSDVCCIDTHLHAVFTGHPARSTIPRRVYLELESRVRALALEFGLSTFAAQWALFDAHRGTANNHAALAVA